MKRYLTPLLFSVANLMAISANANTAAYFIPNKPTVITPAEQASNVGITPEFTSSEFQFSENYEPAVDPTISQSNWIITKKSAGISMLGGEVSSEDPQPITQPGPPTSDFSNAIQYEIPFPITISGQTAEKIKIISPISGASRQEIVLLNSAGNFIASANVNFTDYTIQNNSKFIIAKSTANSLQIQFHLTHATTATQGIVEFILLDGGFDDGTANADVFGFRTSPNEFTDALFTKGAGYAECRIPLNSTSSVKPSEPPFNQTINTGRSLSDWKSALSANYDKFFLGCSSTAAETVGEYKIQLKELTPTDVTSLLSELEILSSSTGSHTLTNAERLSLSTEYTAQVQHIATSGTTVGSSNWSIPSFFTTRAADTNYQITVPADLVFTPGQAKNLAFKIANTGSETGIPQVTIRLPFNIFSVLNGTLTDFFKVSIDGRTCAMNQSGEVTDFICQLDSLAANAEIQLSATVTAKDASVKNISYQVCDTEKCDATVFTAIDITVTNNIEESSSSSSSSSSSGGSLFWLLLMAPLLLIRQKS